MWWIIIISPVKICSGWIQFNTNSIESCHQSRYTNWGRNLLQYIEWNWVTGKSFVDFMCFLLLWGLIQITCSVTSMLPYTIYEENYEWIEWWDDLSDISSRSLCFSIIFFKLAIRAEGEDIISFVFLSLLSL